jgi:CHAT domain-containing protein/tetratricopeptide (TPR) repeat protein
MSRGLRISRRCVLALALFPGLTQARLGTDEARPAVFRDDFATNTLKDYQVTGEVTWQKGAVTLGPGAKLSRKLALGYTAEVRAVVRWPQGQRDGEVHLRLLAGKNQAAICLERVAGKTALAVGTTPRRVVALERLGVGPAEGASVWVVRLEVSYGLAQVRAWPPGSPEPRDWQTLHYSGRPGWQPGLLVAEAGKPGSGVLLALAANGVARLVLSQEQQQLLQQAGTLDQEGFALSRQGKYGEALAKAREILPLHRQAFPANHPGLAIDLGNVGRLLQDLGKYGEARPYLEEALAIYRQALPANHPELARSLTNLGSLLQDLGKYGEARPYLEEALAIHRKALPANHPDLATSLNDLGLLLKTLGKSAEARSYLEEALAIDRKVLPANHPRLAASLNNLGTLLQEMGKYAEARTCYEEALAIDRKVLPANHPRLAGSLSNLGLVLRFLGQPAEARSYLEEALAIQRKALPANHPNLALSLGNLGLLLTDLGKPAEARPYFEEALAIKRKALPANHPRLAPSLNNLGTLLYELGEKEQAWQHCREAATAWTAYGAQTAAASAQRDHAALSSQNRFVLDRFLSLAEQTPTLSAAHRRDTLMSVLDGKSLSTTALTLRQEAVLVGTDRQAAELWGQLKPVRQQLADLLLQGPGRLSPERYRGRCLELQQQQDVLERALAQQVSAYSQARRANRASPATLTAQLPGGAVLVEFVRYFRWDFQLQNQRQQECPAYYLALLLWRPAGKQTEPEVRLVRLGAAQPIDQAIHAWRSHVQEGGADVQADRALRERVWQPVAQALPEATTRLIVAPDGELALLPFEAIREADGNYLIERLAISYVSTGRDLMPRPLPPQKSDRALVLADPDYDAASDHKPVVGPPDPDAELHRSADLTRAGVRFRSLPGFAREADTVARLLQGKPGWRVQQYHREQASEETLAGQPRPRLLYCITHGFFLKDLDRLRGKTDPLRELELVDAGPRRVKLPDPGDKPGLRSGLALAGANRWQERSAQGVSDGLLTALEVEDLDLWGTELVVLSACETGLGEVQVGEGVLGLRRAFQQAGAQTVLASLWKVPDNETEQLMTGFFQRWLAGSGKADALRQAQLELIRRLRASKEAKHRQAPPLYWAGFICHGQP